MNTNRIEEIYRFSENKFNDLYMYFLNHCGFQILSTKLCLGYDTYRIRDYKELKEIKTKDNVKYPPSSSFYSRIGKPNQIWFYTSDDYNVPFAEMMPIWYSKINPGENIKIILSIWHIRHEITVLIIPDLININDVCKRLDLSAYYHDQKFWSFICNKFRTTTLEDKNIYEFTSAFSNVLMDRAKIEGKNVDGIFYPSVQYPLKSNLALYTSCIDNDKVVLKNLLKAEFNKSKILSYNGKPNYIQISDFEPGFYNPEKDTISWTK
jgi:hypothetical protein